MNKALGFRAQCSGFRVQVPGVRFQSSTLFQRNVWLFVLSSVSH